MSEKTNMNRWIGNTLAVAALALAGGSAIVAYQDDVPEHLNRSTEAHAAIETAQRQVISANTKKEHRNALNEENNQRATYQLEHSEFVSGLKDMAPAAALGFVAASAAIGFISEADRSRR